MRANKGENVMEKVYTAEEIEKAQSFLRSPDACHYACQDCENPAPECVASREAAALINEAAIARSRAKPKGSDVVPDHATSPYPCGREAMHEAGCCECHGHHP